MGTSDTASAQEVLRSLDDADVEYGLLHGADDVVALNPISDLDVAVFIDPWRIVENLRPIIRARAGLRLVMTWEYDVGALTTFWLSDDGLRGVQLDLLHDSRGVGRYGLRTSRELAHRVDRSHWPPRLDDDARTTYLLSKRLVKGDLPRARALVDRLRGPDGPRLHAELLSEPCRARALRALRDEMPRPWDRHFIRWRSRLNVHLADRIRYPTGIVAVGPFGQHEPRAAASLESLRQVLAHVTVLDREPGRLRRWLLTRRPVLVLYPGPGAAPSMSELVTELEAVSVRRISKRVGRWDDS